MLGIVDPEHTKRKKHSLKNFVFCDWPTNLRNDIIPRNWKDYETLLTELAPLSSIVHTADGSSFLVDLVNHQVPPHVGLEGKSDYQNLDFLHEISSRIQLYKDEQKTNDKQKTNHKRKGKAF